MMLGGALLSLFDAEFERLAPFHAIWGPEGELLKLSEKAERFLKGSGESAVGEEPLSLVHPFESPISVELLQELTLMTLHISYASNPLRYIKGEVICIERSGCWLFTGMPPLSSLKGMEELGVNLRDLPLHFGVTDYLLANEAANISLKSALSANRELEAQAEELERALAELRSTQQALVQQERLKALGEMVSGITHDFNNLLIPILSYSELLSSEPKIEAEERAEMLSLIHTAAQDGASMIKRLRALYKPSLNSSAHSLFELSRVMDDALALAQPRLKRARAERAKETEGLSAEIKVQRDYEAELYTNGMESELRQALLNLIINAGDAMPEGGVLTLSTGSSEAEVWFEVSDTGTGMSAEQLKRCQEPFFSTKGTKGSGLGLPMVMNTAVQHMGRLELHSQLGEGSRFTLYLPRSALRGDEDFEEP